MSLFILLYIGVISCFILLTLVLYKSYIKLIFGRYLLLAIVAYTLWLILYLLAFTTTFNPEILLYISRALYSISFVAIYSMLLFFLTYGYRKHKIKKYNQFQIIFVLFSGVIISGSIFSPFFIEKMIYNPGLQIYYESFGILFPFLKISYFLNPIFVIGAYVFNNKKLFGLNKIRFKYLFAGYIFFLILYVLFLAILPNFGIWMFQREQILFFIPFLVAVFYTSHRYRFSNIKIGLRRLIVFIASLIGAFFITHLTKLYLSLLDERLLSFWGVSRDLYFSILDLTLFIFLFVFLFLYLSDRFLSSTNTEVFEKYLGEFHDRFPFLQNEYELNNFLKREFKNKLNISDTQVVRFINGEHMDQFSELNLYFEKDSSRDIFLNDYVFLTENKTKYNLDLIVQQLDNNISMYVPIFKNRDEILGYFLIGKKPFGDFYSQQDIDNLKKFTGYLQGHFSYISVYKEIQDLSINLDRKVDEKTMEYNNLLSKQKDFIAYVGHEIKNSITNTLFLSDSIKDEIKGKVDDDTQEDVIILYDELVKVSKLVKYIFSAEKFDLDKSKLFLNNLDLSRFITEELHHFKHHNEQIQFSGDIELGIMCSIDEIQFRQVIHNLVNNSIKFIESKNPKISMSLRKHNKKIEILIEDNGSGFTDNAADNIFSKYITGSGSAIGLGMGLYLCKKIVELHSGSISATNSSTLGGAKFIITL